MWLHIPPDYMDCHSAQGLGDSNSDLESLAKDIELCVTLSGKPTQRPLSWHAWRNRPWIKRLFGTILRPSMANRGVEKWILSLPDCHASHIPAPAKAKDGKTSDAQKLSQTFCESFGSANQQSYFARTCQNLLLEGIFGPCVTSYEEWVMKCRRRSSLVRKVLERRRGETEFLRWPSIRASDQFPGLIVSRLRTEGINLNEAAAQFTAFFLHTNPELMNGIESLPKTLNLRPVFTEWLMGFPREWTACDAAVTGLFRYKQRMRSELCALMQE